MRLGVTMQAVQDVLYDAFGQRQVSTIFAQANQYRVVLEADPSWQADPDSLDPVRVPGTGGAQVPLIDHRAASSRPPAPLAITHQAQFPSVTLSFNLADGASLGDAVDAVPRPSARSACRRPSSAAIPATPPSSSSRWPASPG